MRQFGSGAITLDWQGDVAAISTEEDRPRGRAPQTAVDRVVFDTEPYFKRSQWPLQSLVFIAPFLLFYEVGVHHYGAPTQILARSVLLRLLEQVGDLGPYLAGLTVAAVLLGWHVVRRDPARLDWRLYLGMGAESVALSVPLLMFAMIWGRQAAATGLAALAGGPGAGGAAEPTMLAYMVTSVGAGIYEELVFRLFVITLLHFVFVDVIGLRSVHGSAWAIFGAAALFAAYHFGPRNPFGWGKFAFYLLAGGYLGVLFVLRGFGIVVGVHAFYDIFYAAIQQGLFTGEPD